jgi:hypothetical protein
MQRKLSTQDIIDIRKERSQGVTLSHIASKYSIAPSTVSQIALGKTRRKEGGPISTPCKAGSTKKPFVPKRPYNPAD